MKALSFRQPWADFLVDGRKTMEIRKWNTKYRGRFLVHSSKAIDDEALKFFQTNGILSLEYSPVLGAIIGSAQIMSTSKYVSAEQFNADASKHLNPVMTNRAFRQLSRLYGWAVVKSRRLRKPTFYKGKLGLFEVQRPKVRARKKPTTRPKKGRKSKNARRA